MSGLSFVLVVRLLEILKLLAETLNRSASAQLQIILQHTQTTHTHTHRDRTTLEIILGRPQLLVQSGLVDGR